MIILGNKYKLSDKEREQLSQRVNKIVHIDTDLTDDIVIEEIKNHIDNIEFIVLNLGKELSLEVESFLEELDNENVKIITFSEFAEEFLQKNININEENLKVLQTVRSNVSSELLKRAFDIVFSATVLIVLFPVFLIIAILIKMKSPDGSIFFTQQRLGHRGKFFRVFKFRTMVVNAEKVLEDLMEQDPKIKEEYLTYRKLKKDPRIIPVIGEFLRKTSLDELPQFFNVLIGDMSVVGPRPYIKEEFVNHPKSYVDIITLVKPGITGYWQVTERNNATFDERVQMDMEYIEKQNFWLDLEIIYKTVLVMVFRKGAY